MKGEIKTNNGYYPKVFSHSVWCEFKGDHVETFIIYTQPKVPPIEVKADTVKRNNKHLWDLWGSLAKEDNHRPNREVFIKALIGMGICPLTGSSSAL